MKPDIHPFYRTVVFHDTSEIEFEGEMYPYVTLDISSKSHPYYTGKQKTFDNEGSAARFQKRFGHFIGVKRG